MRGLPNLAALRVVAWIGACYAVLKTTADPDLWGHVRFGLDLLQTRRLTSVDPYSFTQDVPWINHEWLAELQMGAAYAAFGATGLLMLKGLLVIATLLLVGVMLRRTTPAWRWVTVGLAIVATLPITLTLRPQLWTLLFLAVLCYVLTLSRRARWWLPLLFGVWANTHGGWIVGLGVLSVWSAFELIGPQRPRPAFLSIAGPVAVSLMATLFTPYGLGLWRFLLTTVRLSRPNITEWQPVWRDSSAAVVLWILAVVWVVVALRRARSAVPLRVVVPVAVLALAGLRVNRLAPLSALAGVLLLAPYLPDQMAEVDGASARGRLLLDAVFSAVAVFVLIVQSGSANCIDMRGRWTADAAGAAALRAANASGRLVTWFEWGEYAIWHLGPRLKVSMDGRRETVYSERVVDQQGAVADGASAGLTWLAESRPEYVWLPEPQSNRARVWLEANEYRVDVDSGRSFVAVRQDLQPLQPVAVQMSGCFPGP